MNKKINLVLLLFLMFQIIWVLLYFNNYLPSFPLFLVRLFWLSVGLGGIITGIFSIRVKNNIALSILVMIFGVLMIMLWLLGFLITRM